MIDLLWSRGFGLRCNDHDREGRVREAGARVRAKRLLKDQRCTLYVHEPTFNFLALEAEVTILDDEAVNARA